MTEEAGSGELRVCDESWEASGSGDPVVEISIPCSQIHIRNRSVANQFGHERVRLMRAKVHRGSSASCKAMLRVFSHEALR